MSDTLRQRAQAFLAAADKATLGPWHRAGASHRGGFAFGENEIVSKVNGEKVVNWGGFDHSEVPKYRHRANAAYIVAARNDAPALVADLLARVEQLEQAISQAQLGDPSGWPDANWENAQRLLAEVLPHD